MSVVLSTAGLPAADRLAYWHDVVCRTFYPLEVALADKTQCSGSVTIDQLGQLTVSTIDAQAQQVSRTPRLIAASSQEYMMVGLATKGQTVLIQDEREAVLRPGDLAFNDSTRPYQAVWPQHFQLQVFHVPRDAFGLSHSVLGRITSVAIRGDEELGALVSPFISKLATQTGVYSATGDRLGATAVDLLAALITRQLGDEDKTEPRASALLSRIHAYIAHRLAEPELSPKQIAGAHNISVRYLHRLFEMEDITVHRWIQQCRLQECRRALLSATGPGAPTIAAIARRWGFTDAAYFSRAFRARYGMSPRALRSVRAA